MQIRLARQRFPWLRVLGAAMLGLMAASLLMAARPAHASAQDARIPFPPELQREVQFWIRVYSEISTSEGFLHDDRDLGIVYRKLRFEANVTPAARRRAVAEARTEIERMLRRLAAGAHDLSDEEQRTAAGFGPQATPARFAEAARAVRFQLGQADRFREGLERAAIWESHIAQTFASRGLPPELAALPHVESSFDPSARSKVGAAGLWQFMRGTGRLYMRVDQAVDERMDPFRATEAAARLLEDNYQLLGSWPLALTAYNHGAAGMRRARDAMGTTDIATIVRHYQSRSFGFASRNFYVSFLAALTIDRDPGRYFSDLNRRAPLAFTEVELPAFMPLGALEKTLQVDRARLRALNPALQSAVWNGSLYVPRGYRLRLPDDGPRWTTALLAQQVPDQFDNQPRTRSYRVRSGDSLLAIAERTKVPLATLARLNGLTEDAELKPRRLLKLPDVPATRIAVARAQDPALAPGGNNSRVTQTID